MAFLVRLDYNVTSFDGRSPRDSVKAAFERGDCKISPARLKNQGFVLLHSLIEGCHEVCVCVCVFTDCKLFLEYLGGGWEALEIHLVDCNRLDLVYFLVSLAPSPSELSRFSYVGLSFA